MRFLLIIISFLLLAVAAPAQQARQYSFTHYSATMGLVSNQVNTVVQDKTGYIWIGTTDGLQRFDGFRYKTFRHIRNDSTSLPTNPVMQLLIDKKQRLWVLFANGKVGIFDPSNFTYHDVPVKMDDPRWVYAHKKLYCDESGRLLLIFVSWGLVTFDEPRQEFGSAYNFIRIPDGLRPVDLAQQSGNGKYWVAFQDTGMAVYNMHTGHLNIAGHNPDNEPAVEKLKNLRTPGSLFRDNRQRIWFISWGPGTPNLHCYDPVTNDFVLKDVNFIPDVKTYYEIYGFCQQRDSSIWVYGIKVLAKYQEKEKKFQFVYDGYLNERSIYYDAVSCLTEDREKNIWVGVKNNGLYRFNPTEEFFTNVNHLNRNTGLIGNGDLMSFAYTGNGNLLTGTWGDGIYMYDKDFNLVPANIKGFDNNGGPSVWHMFPGRDKNIIWMGAQPGIYKYNQATRSVQLFNPAVLQNKTVRQLVEDRQGHLWLGVQNTGLYKWDPALGKVNFEAGLSRFDKGLGKPQVNKLLLDSSGILWVATSADGLYAINTANDSILVHIGKNEKDGLQIAEDGVSSLTEYNDSLLVITTATTVNVYDRKHRTMRSVGTADMISGFIASVETDKLGYVWIATTNGLYRVNVHKRIFVRYSRSDGIDNENFILNASARLPDGRLVFGASNQFIVFDPAAMQMPEGPQHVTITDFRVNNKSLSIDSLFQQKKIILGPNNNSLAIEFSSLNFTTLSLIKFKLEGLDKDWRVSDNTNQAIYSYLPAGNYTFLLSVMDAEGVPGKTITRVMITVRPPFWKTWWFFSLVALLAILLLFWYDRERMRRKEVIQKMRTDIADNLHEKVSTALNNINILSEMARLKADREIQKSKEYIEQIHTKSHNMIIAMDDMLWSINHENDSMEKTVARMKEYLDALKNRQEVNIDIVVDKKVETLSLNMKLRYEAFLTFKEGIKNLISTGAQNCKVYVGYEKSKLIFTTQFDNARLNMQELNNLLHRQDLERRLESMNAKINIQVHKTNSVITLQIPVS